MTTSLPPLQGEHNVMEGFLGCRGSGKSIAAQRRLTRDFGHCYRFAHDPNLSLKYKLPPDDEETGIMRHSSLEAIRARVAVDGSGTNVYSGEDTEPDALIALAWECAAKGLKQVGPDARRGSPSMVLIDEIASWDQASALRAQPGFTVRQLVGRCRPLHTGLIYTAQRASMVHRWILFESTRITLFRLNDRADVERLIEGGFDRSAVEPALELPYWGEKTGEHRRRIEAGEPNFIVIERG